MTRRHRGDAIGLTDDEGAAPPGGGERLGTSLALLKRDARGYAHADPEVAMLSRLRCWMLGGGLLFAASAALAVDPSIKCETDKLRLAAKYTACRLAAEADAVRGFTTPNFDKCENSYLLGWAKAEGRARAKGAPCWTEGDASVVKGDIDAHTGSLAESLGGGK